MAPRLTKEDMVKDLERVELLTEQDPTEIPTPGVRLLLQNEPQTPRPPHDEPMTSFERLIISRMDDITK